MNPNAVLILSYGNNQLKIINQNNKARQELKINSSNEFHQFSNELILNNSEDDNKKVSLYDILIQNFQVQIQKEKNNYDENELLLNMEDFDQKEQKQNKKMSVIYDYYVDLNNKHYKMKITFKNQFCFIMLEENFENQIIKYYENLIFKMSQKVEKNLEMALNLSQGIKKSQNDIKIGIKTKILLIINNLSNLQETVLQSRGKFNEQFSYFQLNIFLENIREIVVNELKLLKKNDDVNFYISNMVDPNQFRLYQDGFKLTQLILNLLENSINNTQRGNIILKIDNLSPGSNILKIEIQDTGNGFQKFSVRSDPNFSLNFNNYNKQKQQQNDDFLEKTKAIMRSEPDSKTYYKNTNLGMKIAYNLTGQLGPKKELVYISSYMGTSVSFQIYLRQKNQKGSCIQDNQSLSGVLNGINGISPVMKKSIIKKNTNTNILHVPVGNIESQQMPSVQSIQQHNIQNQNQNNNQAQNMKISQNNKKKSGSQNTNQHSQSSIMKKPSGSHPSQKKSVTVFEGQQQLQQQQQQLQQLQQQQSQQMYLNRNNSANISIFKSQQAGNVVSSQSEANTNSQNILKEQDNKNKGQQSINITYNNINTNNNNHINSNHPTTEYMNNNNNQKSQKQINFQKYNSINTNSGYFRQQSQSQYKRSSHKSSNQNSPQVSQNGSVMNQSQNNNLNFIMQQQQNHQELRGVKGGYEDMMRGELLDDD
ncbi:Histidine kinase-like ATPase, ATP-binding domain [Pseudocohnilembus persalinus]|uniref:Histidine kinase-like ATPase, ATP-binding domain n=1 Tax=Pseudocohnilembus persalinus TaxID=266149 RepID=A0A0V0QA96_PSEPJ|nr:Histidine kinase-like ATPase, ATP-binding domain [Pseudocohnilembus persalinus]|eukprot:KRW99082.1 Histidine kinase-like ATPase, ATP-binding domain [Pseudocohnilembus persalinus]